MIDHNSDWHQRECPVCGNLFEGYDDSVHCKPAIAAFTEEERGDLHIACFYSGESTEGGLDTCVINGYEVTRDRVERLGALCQLVIGRSTDVGVVQIAIHGYLAVQRVLKV
jgi:hypothetical protein